MPHPIMVLLPTVTRDTRPSREDTDPQALRWAAQAVLLLPRVDPLRLATQGILVMDHLPRKEATLLMAALLLLEVLAVHLPRTLVAHNKVKQHYPYAL